MNASYEIERKFLVQTLPDPLPDDQATLLRQGYIATGDSEVRLRHDGATATLTCKQGSGLKRREEEIQLSQDQFDALWPLTESCRIEKTRYRIPYQNRTIELDVYHGTLAPLLTAEVEFEDERQSEQFQPPSYFSQEVTEDSRYKNQKLALLNAPPKTINPA